MNKVILMGRLTRDPETRYSQSNEPVAVTRYTLAVNRSFKREGQPDADFINIVSFGKRGEFAEKYFRKGQMVAVVGRLQVRSWDDDQGKRHWITEVVAEEQHFAESKASFESRSGQFDAQQNNSTPFSGEPEGFYPIDENLDDEDLPF
jgi:single-strand DNA-binding protein